MSDKEEVNPLDKLVIEGGKPLSGTIRIHGAKNAALPILAASLLAEGSVKLLNVPQLLDIDVMLDILRNLGCRRSTRNRRCSWTARISLRRIFPSL
uniref:hypothetical protein n=1 Tax=Cohnella faecalis TaxID=2315694 RepID=UPI0026CAF12B|nr:hypothetical protein [Cohnella faecalis]